ncbi:sigma 54-interacting transcriptional regulator [uncultured Desulfosarcina sp.]|uniref:sigma 54-interacting transcriptional regulator n=1 Tax=uncultured Desulfosarcina sp. TaxID=218289 RepID=UPI0029C8C283|nr:sigma 54-interacting transcriptional regulator [uncultured Desulfosarcina sp.]
MRNLITPLLSNDNAAILGRIIETMGSASPGLVISGEGGLGKEAIIQLLYGRSFFRGYPFIKVNCPMLSDPGENEDAPCIEDLSSNPQRSGFSLFRLFHQGVLYFHGVDELAVGLQDRLLFLLKRKFLVAGSGSNGAQRQLAIFSTATRPLEACVSAGKFHPDLCALLSGVTVHIPPLRQFPERIGSLVEYFLKRLALREGRRTFPRPTATHLARMRTHRWPGNLRELQAVVSWAIRSNDWNEAITMLRQDREDDYSVINLTTDGLALMPHFEITRGNMLDKLSEKIPAEELGLMDLVLYEEIIANNMN